MEQEALYFSENGIIKNAFYKNKKYININEIDIKRIVLSDKKSYDNKDVLNTLLDIDIKVMLSHCHYV